MEINEIAEALGAEKVVRLDERLGQLGFLRAGAVLKELKEKKRKLAVAYEHYRFVRVEKIAEFNQKLYDETRIDSEGYKYLSFTPIEAYEKFPPQSVLDSLQTALDRKCFDNFQVAHIERVKDPILFGYVQGCTDAFFIDQWDNDVKIEEILKSNEG